MKVAERRKAIVNLLLSSKEPVSGSELAQKFNVSRQTVVQDITVLKGTGYEILSTSMGYVMQKTPLAERVFKLKHTTEQTEDELSCIVELGGTVVDVFVWHKVYGKVEAPLNIFSPMHVKQFMEGVRTGQSSELMHITGGYHYHTVRAENEDVLDRIEAALNDRNYIVPEI
jgi:transcriptional regulator of NAD metabolism